MSSRVISVTQPVGQAINRAKDLLFHPFDAGRWFTIGFCAWLAYLGEGAGSSFHFPGKSHGHGASFRQFAERANDYLRDNLYWILPVGIAVIVLGLIGGAVVTWLRSRGDFMFLHCIARNKSEVVAPWREFKREGNSLFCFRLVLLLVAVITSWPLLIFGGIKLYRMYFDRDWTAEGILQCVGLGLALVLVGIALGIVAKFTSDFVIPIMFMRRMKCLDAWREFGRLLRANPGEFIVYLLFQIVLAIAIVIMLLVVIVVTCCIAGCLLALPYLGTVLLLPVLVFRRAYSLCYLMQYGSEYDAFAVLPAPPPLAPGPTAAPS